MRIKQWAGARAYPDAQTAAAASGLLCAEFGRVNARLPSGRGNTTEHQRSFPPQCVQHIAVLGVKTSEASCGALAAKPCANSMRPLTSSIGNEKLGERKPK